MSLCYRKAAHWEKSSLRKGFVALKEITWAVESPWQQIFKHMPEEHGDGWSGPHSLGVRVHQCGETLGIAEGPRAAGFHGRKEYFGQCLINSLAG